jgi:hypothetical protein
LDPAARIALARVSDFMRKKFEIVAVCLREL